MKAVIGLAYLQKTKYWHATFSYTQTNTSSFTVGWSENAGGYGAAFSAAGSETTSSTDEAGGTVDVNSGVNSATGRAYWITVHSSISHWRCWNSSTTPPASPGNWPDYLTIEPGAWARDFAADNVKVPACNVNNANNQFRVGGGAQFHRNTGSSTTISSSINGSVSAPGGPISFHLGANVENSNTTSDLVNYAWRNTSTGNKFLCGIDAPPLTGRTRVVAIGLGT
jgi:hypothetical protein